MLMSAPRRRRRYGRMGTTVTRRQGWRRCASSGCHGSDAGRLGLYERGSRDGVALSALMEYPLRHLGPTGVACRP